MESPDERYFRYFAAMSRRGLYSFDSTFDEDGVYYAVTIPATPLKIDELPPTTQRKLRKTTATVRFRETSVIAEKVTLLW